MKKAINGIIAASLILGLYAGKSYGQDQKNGIMLAPVVIVGTPAVVEQNIVSTFHKSFANAVNARWFRQKNNYLVKFIMNDENCMSLYTKRGRMIYNIIYGFEKDLADGVRQNIKDSYRGYTITSATNVNQDLRNMWYVNLVDEKGYMQLKIENGEMVAGDVILKSL